MVNLKIHFAYIVGILLVLLLMVISIKFGDNEKLLNYFTFALTLSSIFLALIAIVYSFISNNSLSKNLMNVEKAASQITNESEKLSHTSSLLIEKLEEIPNMISGVDKKIIESYDLIKLIHNKSTYQENKPITISDTPKKELDESILKGIIEYGSYNTLCALYAIKLAYDKKMPFNLASFVKASDIDINYTLGALSLCSCLKVFSYSEKENIWNITYLNTYISENIKKAYYESTDLLVNRIIEIYKDKDIPEKHTKEFRIKSVEDYFLNV